MASRNRKSGAAVAPAEVQVPMSVVLWDPKDPAHLGAMGIRAKRGDAGEMVYTCGCVVERPGEYAWLKAACKRHEPCLLGEAA